MTRPFFSIVVPAYNRAPFLSGIIASFARQGFADFELLVVDDGSTDDTAAVVQAAAVQDNRVRYLHQPNAERGAARNRGIREAQGSFVLFIDSDDEPALNYLQLLHDAILLQPQINFFAAKYRFKDAKGEYASTMAPIAEDLHGLELVLRGNPFACNFCIRKDNPRLVLFDEDRTLATTEDWMFLVANLRTDKIYVIDALGLWMHQHDGRSMQNNSLLIERRIKATEKLVTAYKFTASQQQELWAWSYYFCSVHAYLDGDNRSARQHIRRAARSIGWNSNFLKAMVKYRVGRAAIVRLKKQFG